MSDTPPGAEFMDYWVYWNDDEPRRLVVSVGRLTQSDIDRLTDRFQVWLQQHVE